MRVVRHLWTSHAVRIIRIELRDAAFDLPDPGLQSAEELQYHDDAAFSRQFKRHLGLSPSAWLARY